MHCFWAEWKGFLGQGRGGAFKAGRSAWKWGECLQKEANPTICLLQLRKKRRKLFLPKPPRGLFPLHMSIKTANQLSWGSLASATMVVWFAQRNTPVFLTARVHYFGCYLGNSPQFLLHRGESSNTYKRSSLSFSFSALLLQNIAFPSSGIAGSKWSDPGGGGEVPV